MGVVLVTGASRSLGAAMARALGAAGWSVAVNYAHDDAGAGAVVDDIVSAGGKAAAFRFLNALKIFRISNNLGDAKSLAVHPATTTHRSMTDEQRAEVGVTEGCIRLSVGLEGLGDLTRDLNRALDKA